MKMQKTVCLVVLCLTLALPASLFAAPRDLSPASQSEITHLLTYLETCGCEFCRNGKWYTDMKAAREHAELKFHYFLDKGRIHSAEDFIAWAASKSEISGKPYLVKCGERATRPTADWLTEELDRYRKDTSRRSAG